MTSTLHCSSDSIYSVNQISLLRLCAWLLILRVTSKTTFQRLFTQPTGEQLTLCTCSSNPLYITHVKFLSPGSLPHLFGVSPPRLDGISLWSMETTASGINTAKYSSSQHLTVPSMDYGEPRDNRLWDVWQADPLDGHIQKLLLLF